LRHEVIADGVGSLFREPLIEIVTCYAIGVAFDFQLQARMTEYDARNLRKLLFRSTVDT
jgi:hypothetical protein